jgi:uncharacterized protein YuzE
MSSLKQGTKLLVVDAKIKAIISEIANKKDIVYIYIEKGMSHVKKYADIHSLLMHQNNPGVIQEDSGAFAMTKIMAIEIMAAIKILIWLESQDYTFACILNDSLRMIWKIEKDTVSSLSQL